MEKRKLIDSCFDYIKKFLDDPLYFPQKGFEIINKDNMLLIKYNNNLVIKSEQSTDIGRKKDIIDSLIMRGLEKSNEYQKK